MKKRRCSNCEEYFPRKLCFTFWTKCAKIYASYNSRVLAMTEPMYERFLRARKQYIESNFSDLNNMQREAVLTTEGPLLLLAGAGSGKTTVLINRIANLLRFGRGSDSNEIPDTVTEEDVLYLEEQLHQGPSPRADYLCAVEPPAPWNVIAITFTNKAANELKQRLCNMLGETAQDVWAMTFHSACCRILRRDAEHIGFSTRFTIYDSQDSERVMKEIIKDMGLDDKTFPAKYVLSVISREKDQMITPDEMMERIELSGDMRLYHVARAYKKYQERLKESDALDFDDIIFKTVELLRDHEAVRTYYQRKFRYVLVDEYQDTNHMQYLLTSMLAGGYENLCVVGDDDQSIYRFRGATIDNILNFEKQYRGSRVIRLEQNYRSTQSILRAANAVIAHNIGRKGKHLWTQNDAGDPITVYEAPDESAEASYISNQIISGSRGKNFKDYAILYRTNAQSNALEFALKRSGIPYRVIGGMRFFDRAEVKDMLSYLCIINNRSDDLRLKRIINNPPRGIGPKALETVERLALAEGQGLYRVISDPYSYGPIGKAAGKFKDFSDMIESLAQLLEEGMALDEFYDEVVRRTGYESMLLLKPTEENKTRLENVRELKSSIHAYIENAEQPSLSGFLEEIALYTDLEQYNEGDDAVVMMTMHSAKGLEFPNVFLTGFEDGLFPGMRAIGDHEEMEEERRLCYVAITRAKKNLTITYAKQRMIYGRTGASLVSRFLRELPEDAIVRKGGYITPGYQDSYSRPNVAYAAGPSAGQYRGNGYLNSSQVQPKAAAYCPDFNKGDMIRHAAFGRGMILSVMKMGGDALLEIAFDDVGTKKLMAKAASAHMKKL